MLKDCSFGIDDKESIVGINDCSDPKTEIVGCFRGIEYFFFFKEGVLYEDFEFIDFRLWDSFDLVFFEILDSLEQFVIE